MKFQAALLVVKNMERSVKFYKEVLGLRVTMDLGANVTLTGGVALQTQESWCEFISKDLQSISFGGNAAELYFEEDKFDDFLKKLAAIKGIFYVHPVQQYSWGQRVIRFYFFSIKTILFGTSKILTIPSGKENSQKFWKMGELESSKWGRR